jgi:hypothetical protein
MSSQEPVYILKNGQLIPYIPATITTGRAAYAASLHVLFKHVADFHICIVKVFSSKYGIPEDDILKTIQESEEFKNMKVDPVLDTDSLGYLAQAPVVESPVVEAPAVKALPKLIAKKMKTKKSVPTTEVPAVEVPAIKAPIQKKTSIASKSKKTKNEDQSEPIASEVPAMHVIDESRETRETREPDPLIKMKPIRKKIVVSKPDTIAIETIESSSVVASVVAHALTLNHECDVPRKIIKKKTNAISIVQ